PSARPPSSGAHLANPLAGWATPLAGCGWAAGAVCCCAGLAGAAEGGALVTLRCTPDERAPPSLAASASVATKAAQSSAAENPSRSFFMSFLLALSARCQIFYPTPLYSLDARPPPLPPD